MRAESAKGWLGILEVGGLGEGRGYKGNRRAWKGKPGDIGGVGHSFHQPGCVARGRYWFRKIERER